MNRSTHQRGASSLDLRPLWLVLTRQWLILLAFVGATALSALLVSLLMTEEYEAVALVQLMPRAGREVNLSSSVQSDAGGYMENRDRMRTQIQVIQSRSVREEVIHRYEELERGDMPSGLDGVGELGGMLSAGPREDTQLVEIRVRHTDPESAALLANLVAEVYAEGNLASRTDAARTARVWLDDKTEAYKQELDETSAQLLTFKAEHGVADIDSNVDAITSRRDALQDALGELTAERTQLEGAVSEHQRLLAKDQTDVLAGMLEDPALSAMLRERASITTKYADVLARYGEQHPEHKQARQHIERIDGLVAEEVRSIVDREQAQLRELRRQEARINGELDEVRAELLAKEGLRDEYEELALEHERAQRLYASLGERGAEVDLEASSRLNDVRLVDPALPPKRPVSPNIPLNLAGGLVVGFAGGLGLAWLRERQTEAILDGADVEQHLGESLLGALPTIPGASEDERAFYHFDRPRSLVAESYRSLRAVLLSQPSSGEGRAIVVTSSLPGEGKTHCCVGLAASFAQLGLSTVLVDTDLRRPKLYTLFGKEESPGLVEAVSEGLEPSQVVQNTHVPRLDIVCPGRAADNPTELLASEAARAFLARLRQDYEVVILDTAPAGLTSDAAALAGSADGILMIVRREHAPRRVVGSTFEQLHKVGAQLLGVALNDMPISKERQSYGEGYYTDRRRPGARRSGDDPRAS